MCVCVISTRFDSVRKLRAFVCMYVEQHLWIPCCALQDMEDTALAIDLVESTTVHITYSVNVFSDKPFVPGADFLDRGTQNEITCDARKLIHTSP